MTNVNSPFSEYEYLSRAITGLRGCIERTWEPIVDDFGDEVEFWVPNQNRWAVAYFKYHSNYITGIGKDDIYIV